MKKILIILTGVLLVWNEPVIAKNEITGIQIAKKIHKERTENTYKCKCGHSVAIKPYEKKVLCHWCNKWVFKNEKDEFKFRLEEQRRKVK